MFCAGRRRIIKREAAKIIFGNFKKFTVFGALMLGVVSGVSMLINEYGILIRTFAGNNGYYSFYVILFIFVFLLLSPLFFGVLELFGEYTRFDGKITGNVFKYYFDKKSFLFSVKNTFFVLIFAAVLCVIPSLMSKLVEFAVIKISFEDKVITGLIAAALRLSVAVVFFGTAIILCGFVCVWRISSEKVTNSMLSCFRLSYRKMRHHKTEFLMLNLSFIPLFAISYLSFGILFVFSVPYYLMSVSVFVTYVMTEENMPVFYSFA